MSGKSEDNNVSQDVGRKNHEAISAREKLLINLAHATLQSGREKGNFDFQSYREINRNLLIGIDKEAGSLRSSEAPPKDAIIHAGNQIKYTPPSQIAQAMEHSLSVLRRIEWTDLTKRDNAISLANEMSFIITVAPFERGNNLTLFVFVDRLTRERGHPLDFSALANNIPKMHDALVRAASRQSFQPLSDLIMRARRSELQRLHPQLGHLTAEAVRAVRNLGNPAIRLPAIGDEIRGRVIARSFDRVLVHSDFKVAAVPDRSFPSRPRLAQDVTIRVLGPDESPSEVPMSRAEAVPVRMTPPLIEAAGSRSSMPVLTAAQIDAHLRAHGNVQLARHALSAATAKVFKDPQPKIVAIMSHRGLKPERPFQPDENELKGKIGLLGENAERREARAAIPNFHEAARLAQIATIAALAELMRQIDTKWKKEQIIVPAPSQRLKTALIEVKVQEVARSPELVEEAHIIYDAFTKRFGRDVAFGLSNSTVEKAARLLPPGADVEEILNVMQPLRAVIREAEEIAHAPSQKRSLAQNGPELGQDR